MMSGLLTSLKIYGALVDETLLLCSGTLPRYPGTGQ